MSNETSTTPPTTLAAAPDAAQDAAPAKHKGGPRCSVCSHERRDEIDRALLFGELTTAEAARIVGVHRSGVSRHVQKHVLPVVAGSASPDASLFDIDIAEEVRTLFMRSRKHMRDAEQTRNMKAIASFHREARADLELLAKLTSLLQQEGTSTINLQVNAEWVQIRQVLQQVLAPWPDARAAVAQALLEVERASP